MTAEERFWAKVSKHDTGCWQWTAAKQTHGYGQFFTTQRLILAHRFSYELLVGPIPEGLTLDHLCRNRACVNPMHLEPVDLTTNQLRGNWGSSRTSAITHCPQGHPYNEQNTYLDPRGKRNCRICHKASARKARLHHPETKRLWRRSRKEMGLNPL